MEIKIKISLPILGNVVLFSFSSRCIFNQLPFSPHCNIEPVEYFIETIILTHSKQRIIEFNVMKKYFYIYPYVNEHKILIPCCIYFLFFLWILNISPCCILFSKPDSEFKNLFWTFQTPFQNKMNPLYEFGTEIIKSTCKVIFRVLLFLQMNKKWFNHRSAFAFRNIW